MTNIFYHLWSLIIDHWVKGPGPWVTKTKNWRQGYGIDENIIKISTRFLTISHGPECVCIDLVVKKKKQNIKYKKAYELEVAYCFLINFTYAMLHLFILLYLIWRISLWGRTFFNFWLPVETWVLFQTSQAQTWATRSFVSKTLTQFWKLIISSRSLQP